MAWGESSQVFRNRQALGLAGFWRTSIRKPIIDKGRPVPVDLSLPASVQRSDYPNDFLSLRRQILLRIRV
jgi:hypothetical protein